MNERPSWAGPTALYRTLGERDLSALGGNAADPPCITPVEGEPLPKRTPTWKTRQGEEVTIGDLVASGVLSMPDAKGRIVGAASDGLIECTLGDHDDPHEKRPRLRVEADDILMLIRKG